MNDLPRNLDGLEQRRAWLRKHQMPMMEASRPTEPDRGEPPDGRLYTIRIEGYYTSTYVSDECLERTAPSYDLLTYLMCKMYDECAGARGIDWSAP